MEKFEDVEKFIIQQAIRHSNEEEEFVWELIEIETFTKIIQFAKDEGYKTDKFDLDLIITEESDDDEMLFFEKMNTLMEIMDKDIKEGKLPIQTDKLYRLMLKEFWNWEG